MKLAKITLMLLGSLFLINASAANSDDINKSAATTAVVDKQGSNRDGEIIAFIIALDKHEVKAADAAVGRKLNSDVIDYAKQMQTDHGKNMTDAQNLSQSINVQPEATKAVENFNMEGKEKLDSMAKLDDKKFEKAYVDAMVSGHIAALAKVDKFQKEANNDSLKKFLSDTASAIQSHLDAAKKLKSEMAKNK